MSLVFIKPLKPCMFQTEVTPPLFMFSYESSVSRSGTLMHPDSHTRNVSTFLYKSPVDSTSYLSLGSILFSLPQTVFQILTGLIVSKSWERMDELSPGADGGVWGGEDGMWKTVTVCPFWNPIWSCDSQHKPFNVILSSMAWEVLLDWDTVYFSNCISCCFPYTYVVTAIHRFWLFLILWPIPVFSALNVLPCLSPDLVPLII